MVLEPTAAVEDEAMQREFDDLMRSSATMKVSLTPDRLKTMEVYKQEKDQRSNRRPVPLTLTSQSDPFVVPPRQSPRWSTLPVESIKEDDEESILKPSRTRQASISNPPKSFPSSSTGRVRAVSTSGVAPRILMKLSRNTSPPVSMPFNAPSPAKIQNHHNRIAKVQGQDQFPPRTRVVQQNRESLDLDDVMGESDEESIAPPPPPVKQISVVTSPSNPRQHAVSASTRDLMDFLAQGPPDTGGRDASDLFSDPQAGESGKSKGSRRLQKMISKLSLGGGDKVRGSHDELSRTKTPQNASRSQLDPTSTTNLSSLANRPIPPRPPPPVSPPSPSLDSFEERSYISSRSHSASVVQKKQDLPEGHRSEPSPSPPTPSYGDRGEQPSPSRRPTIPTVMNGHGKHVALEEPLKHTTLPTVVNGNVSAIHSPVNGSHNRTPRLSSPTKLQVRKPVPVYNATPTDPHVCNDDVRDIRRLLSRATSADECRLIFDMFLARSGIEVERANHDGSHSLPQRSMPAVLLSLADVSLEHALVELLLGGTDFVSEFGVHEEQTNTEESNAAPGSRNSHGDAITDQDSFFPKSDVHSSDERGMVLPR